MFSDDIPWMLALFDFQNEALFRHEKLLANIKKFDIRSSLRLFDFDDEGLWYPFDAFVALIFSFIL